ncbi:universal stress protein [Gordonia sp. ABSL1-1]|uniref:universal stress protein n=1 Tax=Gordonia sp. ABSL1-1 TaxID=3053923 RepID=UPI0025737E69|nr:universal stress protein [Gordonia sp. ABSL1-1]MDL9938795.1 universal stress protein [Gordonia sp. ABSL1-1]
MKLLVAYIATAGGEDAVALGSSLARTFDADLEICIVIPPEPAHPTADVERFADALDLAAKGWLDEAVAKVPDDIRVKTSIAVHANPADGLIRRARRSGAEMMVIGGSGGGIAGRHTLGTVVNDILHSAPIPVALAPAGFSHTGAPEVTRFTVAVGHRPQTPLLTELARSRGVGTHRPVRLLALVALNEVAPWNPDPEPELIATARAHAQDNIDQARARVPEDFADLSSTISEGRTIEDAVQAVEWMPGDVLVVGSSRLAAPATLFLGTTAAKILRTVAVPMIVIPSSE